MVVAVSRSTAPENPNRRPLFLSSNDNNDLPQPQKQKPKHVSSRYMSSTVSTNHNSDTTTSFSSSLSSCSSSTTTTSSPNSVCTPKKRFQSPEDCQNDARRHSGNLRTREMSTRSLSVSFQGGLFALPVSKVSNGSSRLETKANPVRTSVRSRVDFTSEKMKFEHKKVSLCDFDKSDHVRRVGGGGARAIMVPARFWQETINRVRRVPSDSVSTPFLKNKKMISEYNVLRDGPKRGFIHSLGEMPSILSFSADARRGKSGEKKLVDAHVLRLLHNKHLQWRFANAKVDASMVVQRATAQKSLFNAWVTISKLSHSVISKRLEMQHLKQNLKLHSVLKKQMVHLDNWDVNKRDHVISLAGATTALDSSSLCLPVLCGAKADIQNLKDAIFSAVDVMQAMSISLCSLVNKVEQVNSLASELANAMKTECSLLYECKDLFSTLTLLEMEDCSMRTHTLQHIPPRRTTQWRKRR